MLGGERVRRITAFLGPCCKGSLKGGFVGLSRDVGVGVRTAATGVLGALLMLLLTSSTFSGFLLLNSQRASGFSTAKKLINSPRTFGLASRFHRGLLLFSAQKCAATVCCDAEATHPCRDNLKARPEHAHILGSSRHPTAALQQWS